MHFKSNILLKHDFHLFYKLGFQVKISFDQKKFCLKQTARRFKTCNMQYFSLKKFIFDQWIWLQDHDKT